MEFPLTRMRRLRKTEGFRNLVRETELSLNDLVYPLFVRPGRNVKEEIPSMPGNYHYSIDRLGAEIDEISELGIPAVILFGIPREKDENAGGAYDEDGSVQQAVRLVKERNGDLLVITDVCLCQYTDHGHCGVIEDGYVDNDRSLELLAKTALSHAGAGADMVAPSDMMDGRVGAIRNLLDEEGFETIPIMSYSAKYASSFYGPFRDAAYSSPQFGDRRSYQMDPANGREALREAELDVYEGADIIMVKPALAYLDVIRSLRENLSLPVAAYNVSGEFSMVKAAAERGWLDYEGAMTEILTAVKRAGADIILTYFAKDAARLID